MVDSTLEKLISGMFEIPIIRVRINQNCVPINFEERVITYSKKNDIKLYIIDFDDSTEPLETFVRSVTKEFYSPDLCFDLRKVFNMLNYEEQNVLFIIKNLEVLTPIKESFTFTLRSWLTAQTGDRIRVFFVSEKTTLDEIFNHSKAALYHAAIPMNKLV